MQGKPAVICINKSMILHITSGKLIILVYVDGNFYEWMSGLSRCRGQAEIIGGVMVIAVPLLALTAVYLTLIKNTNYSY